MSERLWYSVTSYTLVFVKQQSVLLLSGGATRAIGEHFVFGDTLEDMIQYCLVCGNNACTQCRLLQEQDLTYDTAFEKAQSMEAAAQNVANKHVYRK